MNEYAGLDVSLEETAIAVVDESGRTVREGCNRAGFAAPSRIIVPFPKTGQTTRNSVGPSFRCRC